MLTHAQYSLHKLEVGTVSHQGVLEKELKDFGREENQSFRANLEKLPGGVMTML